MFQARSPEDVARVFQEPLPQEGQDPWTVLNEWSEMVVLYATHIGSPRFFRFVIGSGTMMGTLAEALVAAVNMNAGDW